MEQVLLYWWIDYGLYQYFEKAIATYLILIFQSSVQLPGVNNVAGVRIRYGPIDIE
jgi:hypothetical protein